MATWDEFDEKVESYKEEEEEEEEEEEAKLGLMATITYDAKSKSNFDGGDKELLKFIKPSQSLRLESQRFRPNQRLRLRREMRN